MYLLSFVHTFAAFQKSRDLFKSRPGRRGKSIVDEVPVAFRGGLSADASDAAIRHDILDFSVRELDTFGKGVGQS